MGADGVAISSFVVNGAPAVTVAESLPTTWSLSPYAVSFACTVCIEGEGS